MSARETSEIRELTADEMEAVAGGLTPVFLFPVLKEFLALIDQANRIITGPLR